MVSEKVKCNNVIIIRHRMVYKMSDNVDIVTIELNGEKMNFLLGKKDFKTGSRGYHAQGKMMSGGKNYQVNILVVEIGSKPKEKASTP